MSLAFKPETLNEEVSVIIACGRVRLKHFNFLVWPLLCIMHKQLLVMIFGPLVMRKLKAIWNKKQNK